MSDDNPLVVATDTTLPRDNAPPPPTPEPAQAPPPTNERGQVWSLLGGAVLIGWLLPVLSVCGILVVPIGSVICLAIGPFLGFVLGAFAAVRGEQVDARWLVGLGLLVALGSLFGAVVVWGLTAAGVWELWVRYPHLFQW